MKVVVRELPLMRTTEPETKPVPSTRSENAELASAISEGNSEVSVGAVFGTGRSKPSTRVLVVSMMYTLLALSTATSYGWPIDDAVTPPLLEILEMKSG